MQSAKAARGTLYLTTQPLIEYLGPNLAFIPISKASGLAVAYSGYGLLGLASGSLSDDGVSTPAC